MIYYFAFYFMITRFNLRTPGREPEGEEGVLPVTEPAPASTPAGGAPAPAQRAPDEPTPSDPTPSDPTPGEPTPGEPTSGERDRSDGGSRPG